MPHPTSRQHPIFGKSLCWRIICACPVYRNLRPQSQNSPFCLQQDYSIISTRGRMMIVKKFRTVAEASSSPKQAWVSAFMKDPTGLGQESFVYMGCSKKIAPPGFLPWSCRKRVGTEGPSMADEHLNHCHEHDGDCSANCSGIPCFAMSIVVSDYSGTVNAEVWAPSMHLLGMAPSQWLVLSKEAKAKAILLACKRPYEMLLMSISHGGVFSHIKVQFVKPAAYNPRNECLGELASKLECISVLEESEEESVCTAGIQFSPPVREFPFAEVLKEAVGLISEAYQKNAKAVSLLHEIMGHLSSQSSP